jgi:hypothetical protein
MAKITITLEDHLDKVKVVSDPNFETMIKMEVSGTALTSAHGYAIAALNAIRAHSKAPGPSKILIPRIGH